MRAVARAAGTNTPAVYRRFKDRRDLVRGLLLRIAHRIREDFAAGETLEQMAEAYVDSALRMPHEYELFYTHSRELTPPRGSGKPRPIRESRPNFRFMEQLLANRSRRLSRASHPAGIGHLGDSARHNYAASFPIHSRWPRRRVARRMPRRGEGPDAAVLRILSEEYPKARRATSPVVPTRI